MTRRPKKSEMLEVRLSYEDKEALKRKAATDGLTVSAAVRRLIADYLREPDTVVATSPFKRAAMTLIHHPRKTLLAVASAFGASLLLVPTAHADAMKLSLDMEYSLSVMDAEDGPPIEGIRTRRMTTEIHIDDEAFVCLSLEGQTPCFPDQAPPPGLVMVLTATQQGDDLRLDVRLADDGETVAEPSILVGPGETGSMRSEPRNGSTFSLSAAALPG